MDTIDRLLGALQVEYDIMGHGPAMPVLLDEKTIKLFPPLHVQLTQTDEKGEYLDFVYLLKAKALPAGGLKGEGSALDWFHQANLQQAPGFVKRVVHQILALVEN